MANPWDILRDLPKGRQQAFVANSITKVTIMGSKDVQRSQIPPNDVIGTSTAKKASALIPMP